MYPGSINTVTTAPIIALMVVATSRNIPILIFVIPSLTYAAADPVEVAITEMIDAPIA